MCGLMVWVGLFDDKVRNEQPRGRVLRLRVTGPQQPPPPTCAASSAAMMVLVTRVREAAAWKKRMMAHMAGMNRAIAYLRQQHHRWGDKLEVQECFLLWLVMACYGWFLQCSRRAQLQCQPSPSAAASKQSPLASSRQHHADTCPPTPPGHVLWHVGVVGVDKGRAQQAGVDEGCKPHDAWRGAVNDVGAEGPAGKKGKRARTGAEGTAGAGCGLGVFAVLFDGLQPGHRMQLGQASRRADRQGTHLLDFLVDARRQAKAEGQGEVPGEAKGEGLHHPRAVELCRLVAGGGEVDAGDGEAGAGGHHQHLHPRLGQESDCVAVAVHVAADVGEGGGLHHDAHPLRAAGRRRGGRRGATCGGSCRLRCCCAGGRGGRQHQVPPGQALQQHCRAGAGRQAGGGDVSVWQETRAWA